MSLAASAVNKPLPNKVMDVCIMLNNNPMHLEEKKVAIAATWDEHLSNHLLWPSKQQQKKMPALDLHTKHDTDNILKGQ